jgi:hypothetical protein
MSVKTVDKILKMKVLSVTRSKMLLSLKISFKTLTALKSAILLP